MGGTYTIYAYFNSLQIQGVLNAVVMLVGSSTVDGDYLTLIRVASMIGIFLAVTLGFVKARGEESAQYLIMVAIFYTTLFVPRVNVTIEEKSGTGGAPIVVANVPLGLAFFASTTSHIGYWLTQSTETFFSLPSTELNLSQHGLMGGARSLREAQAAAIPDPVLAQDMTNFMRDCINPELVISSATIASLMQSTNIWTDLSPGLINPGRIVTILSGGAGAIGCDTAYAALTARLGLAVATEQSLIAKILSPNLSAAAANTALAAMLPAAESLIMTASASAAATIRQRMMINVLNDTSSTMGLILNDPAAVQTALGTAIATSSANSSYRVMAKMAQETLPLVRNAIELTILGIFPIVLILVIIAGSKGGAVMRSYVMTMLWVQLWAPLYAIVNYVATMSHASQAKAALGGIDGVAIANAAAFMNTTISAEAVAGILTITVPIIALAIVKGGEVAMSGVASSMTGGATTAAQTAGAQVGSGNIQMGNTSWGNAQHNNTSANGHSSDLGILSGAATSRGRDGAKSTYFGDGTSVGDVPQHNGPLKTNTAASASSGLSQVAAAKIESSYSHAVAAGENAIAAVTRVTGQGSDRKVANQIGDTGTRNTQALVSDASTVSTKVGTDADFQQGRRNSVAATATGVIGGKIGGEGAFNIGGDPAAATGAPAATTGVPAAATGAPAAATGVPAAVAGVPAAVAGAPAAVAGAPAAATGKKPFLSGKLGLNFGADVAEQAKNDFYKAKSLKDVAGMNKATAALISYAKGATTAHAEGSSTTGSNTARREINAALSNAQSHLDESRANLAESKSYSEAADITRGLESNASYSPVNPGNTSARGWIAENRALATASPSERAQQLEQIRLGAAGNPELPKNHLSGAPVAGSKQAIIDSNSSNIARPELRDTTEGQNRDNVGAVGAGPTGVAAVPLSKKEALSLEAKRQVAEARTGSDKIDGMEAADTAAKNVLKENGQYGRTAASPNAMEPSTTQPQVSAAAKTLALSSALGVAETVVNKPAVKQFLNDHGIDVIQPENRGADGGAWSRKPTTRGE